MRTPPLPPRWTLVHGAIALALAAAISSCGTIDKAINEQSPFRLFGRDDMRAGMKFSVLEETAKRESRPPFRFNCWDTLPKQKMRMCKHTIEPGELFALVNSDKRVIRLLFVSYEPTRLEENYQSNNFRGSIEATTRMKTEFDSVRPRRTLPGAGLTEFRWTDAEPRWSAAMWFRPRDYYLKRSRNSDQVQEFLRRTYSDSMALIPDSIALTDEKAYAELLALNPRPAPYVPDPADAVTAPVAPLPPTAADRLGIMRSDLERLARAQDDYFSANSRYARDLATLEYTPGEGIVIAIGAAGAKGWTARATHPFVPGALCVVYGGEVASPPSAGQMGAPTGPGQAVCDPG